MSDNRNRPLACLQLGAAAWKTQPRDKYIGWNHDIRNRNLELIANNSRFLILPWVTVPNLASCLLGLISRRISGDWTEKYNHPIHLLETFVKKERFEGTCYKAANWLYVGDTTGRTRNGGTHDRRKPVKGIYLYPLHKRFREPLLAMEEVGKA